MPGVWFLCVCARKNKQTWNSTTTCIMTSIRGIPSAMTFAWTLSQKKKKKDSLETQQSLFDKRHYEKEDMVIAPYKIALLIRKKKKPFSDAEKITKPSLEI